MIQATLFNNPLWLYRELDTVKKLGSLTEFLELSRKI